jgi:hypothetical protein
LKKTNMDRPVQITVRYRRNRQDTHLSPSADFLILIAPL